jgi:hypothetical protein
VGIASSAGANPKTAGTIIKRIPVIAAVTVLAVAGVSAPALAKAKPARWTTAQCDSYKAKFMKNHRDKRTSTQIAAGNRTLGRHGCTIKL